MKQRLRYLAIALSVIPVGLIARSMRGEADASTAMGFVTTYLGDTLWAVMFFFFFAAMLPSWRTWSLGVLTLTFTIAIETSQLYRGEPLASLRSFPTTRFLLGTNFLWSDVICLTVGTAFAAGLHNLLTRPRAALQKG
jgi:hypothetical protein